MKALLLIAVVTLFPVASASADSDRGGDGSECDTWTPGPPCWRKPWRHPELVVSLEGGMAALVESGPFGFGKGTGSATDFGGTWGLGFGVDFFRWLGLEARYVGIFNSGNSKVSQAGPVGLLTDGGEAFVRFTLPLPYVRPYLFGGVGYYDTHITGSLAAKTVSTLTNNDSLGFPMGVGVEVPLGWHFTLGAEATFRFLLSESFSNAPARDIEGADYTTFSGVAKWHL